MKPGNLVKIVYQVSAYPSNLTNGTWITESFAGVKMGNLANIKEGDVGLVIDGLTDYCARYRCVVLIEGRCYALSPHWIQELV